MQLAFVTLLLAIAMPASAQADEMFAVTPSGSAETVFPGEPNATIAKLTASCIDAGWTVTTSSSHDLTCEAPLNMGQSVMGQVLLGNRYSTPPRRFFRFNAAQLGNITRVQASGWIELQMALGQIRRTDFSGPEFQNSIMQFMQRAGGHLPTGTRFPNHALLGVTFGDTIPLSRGIGIIIRDVETGSPANQAGVLAGDMLTRVADKRLSDLASLFDALAKAARNPSYKVEVVRAGQTRVFTLNRAFRPPVIELTFAASEKHLTQAAGGDGSVADGLAKLAKLRTEGVLTEEEFQGQKYKLLER